MRVATPIDGAVDQHPRVLIPTGLSLDCAVDLLPKPTILIDEDGYIVAANRAYRDYYGVDPIGKQARLHSGKNAWGHAQVECLVRHPCRGRVEYVQIRCHALYDLQGKRYWAEECLPIYPNPQGLNVRPNAMVGSSPVFMDCLHQIFKAARTHAPVLLRGESGTGKELAAHALHQFSERAAGPLLTVDCSTMTEHLFESEFMGHERGAFTGCIDRKIGLYEHAHRGTLFLDEIGELPLTMQAKLLRVLETGLFRRLGGTELLHADVRIVAATNRDLPQMIREKRFREDLYYRLAAIEIDLPALRERVEDIPEIVQVLLERINRAWRGRWQLSDQATRLLCTYKYPGNIRELRNILQKALALCDGDMLLPRHIHFFQAAGQNQSGTAMERPSLRGRPDNFRELLAIFEGSRRQLAKHIGVSERTVYRWLQEA